MISFESVRNLAAENIAARFLTESTYKNRGKEYPIYEMGKDGFWLLAMSFMEEKVL